MKLIFASLDCRTEPEMLCSVEIYEGIGTYFRRGYRVRLFDMSDGTEVLPECTTSPHMAAQKVFLYTDNGEGEGFWPNLLELEEV